LAQVNTPFWICECGAINFKDLRGVEEQGLPQVQEGKTRTT